MLVYQLMHLPPETGEHHMFPYGVYLNFTGALEAARSIGGEWSILRFSLDRPDRGTVVWESYAEGEMRDKPAYRELYRRFWPTGFPDEQSKIHPPTIAE
jgi:hypothetical protein